ncbi:acyloxyacyl hydrolase [Sphingomonas sp. RS2018]
MMVGKKGVLGAAMLLVCTPAAAQAGYEIGVGVYRHGANFHPLGSKLTFPARPAGVVLEDQEEDGTTDALLLYRSAPLKFLLKPRLTAKAQISLEGRTSFASLGAEWRQHILKRRIYGQVGIGITVHDGYRFTPDPFEPGIARDEARRRYDIYLRRVSFGSQVLFNPNASIGVRIDRRWAAELSWEHFSHRQIFNEQNPGIDHLGLRLIRTFGGR